MYIARPARWVLALVATTAIAATGWWVAYPGPADAKGPRYQLWKAGLLGFDPHVVYPAMVADRHREELVLGLTVLDLQRRFGPLRSRGESTAAYQAYYAQRSFHGKTIYWLGDSAWLVVLENDRVVALHLVKG